MLLIVCEVEGGGGIQNWLNGDTERREEREQTEGEREKVDRFILRTGGEAGKFVKGEQEGDRGGKKKAWDCFSSKRVFFHSHDSERIPAEITRSGGIDGVFRGKRSRGEESECARVNHASFVDPNFGSRFEPR